MTEDKIVDADDAKDDAEGARPEEPVEEIRPNDFFKIGQTVKDLRIAQAVKGLELGATFKSAQIGEAARSVEAARAVKHLELGQAFKSAQLGEVARGLEAAQAVKNLGIGEIFKNAQLGETLKSLQLGQTVIGQQVGDAFRDMRERLSMFDMSRELLSIGRTIQEFRALPVSVANSEFSRSFVSIGEVVAQINRSVIEPSSSMFQAARAVAEISSFKSAFPAGMLDFLNSPERTQLFDLIHSGRIDVEQVVEGFDDAVSLVETVDSPSDLDSSVTIADAHKEVVNALLSRGSLKGVSPAGMRYFFWFVICVVLPAIVTFSNQSFELQKKVGGLFTEVESPAAARAQARHLPEGANKSQLIGFRVVTGENVYLMYEPSRKSEEVFKIRIGSLVQVLDATDNSWLYVSVMMDDELYKGWVFRRYTKRIE